MNVATTSFANAVTVTMTKATLEPFYSILLEGKPQDQSLAKKLGAERVEGVNFRKKG